MHIRRSLVPLCAILSLAACASAPTRSPDAPLEIRLDVAASPVRAHDQIAEAFSANGLPVSTSQPGVVEFRAPRERGILGYDEVFARAVIEPAECGTRITLYGEETHYANSTAMQGAAKRIGPSSNGRALDVWRRLQSVAAALRADSARVKT